MAGGADAIFARNQNQAASLQDFAIRKMIGKGTFGKVYLVKNKKSGKFYAMKSIRKDVVIESDSV